MVELKSNRETCERKANTQSNRCIGSLNLNETGKQDFGERQRETIVSELLRRLPNA